MEIRVLSWNIWQGKRREEVLAYLGEQNADIVGLQEVPSQTDHNLAGDIADSLEYHYAYYPSIATTDNTGRGNAVLSRYPIVRRMCHFLSPSVAYDGSPTTEPRIAVQVDLSIDGSIITVLSTHLSYTAHFGPSTVAALQTDTLMRLTRNKAKLILMGDFNALPDSDTVRAISSVLKHTDSALSVPTWTMYPHEYLNHRETRLHDRIDYIFTSRDTSVRAFEVGMSKGASHLPIWAILDVG